MTEPNEEHLKILKQGVKGWNEWRKEYPDVKPDLTRAVLVDTDLTLAHLAHACLTEAILQGSDMRGACLTHANLGGAVLVDTDLTHAKLANANLAGAFLVGSKLIKADLSSATITGAYLYGTARDEWIIDGVKCDFVYWDIHPYVDEREKQQRQQWERENRIPRDRDFRPGEFEELYKQLPTFEYYFEHGLTPLDPLIMDQVVQSINDRRPNIELRLDSFHSRGKAHAVFTVLHKDNIEEVLNEVTANYETRIKVLEGQKEQLMQVVKMLGSGNVMVQPEKDGIKLRHAVSPELTQQIVEFLVSLPELDTEDARRAWIYSASLDASLQQQIKFSGASMQFFQLVVCTVIAYGKQADGRLTIEKLMDVTKQRVGIDRQQQCDRLIQQIQKELSYEELSLFN